MSLYWPLTGLGTLLIVLAVVVLFILAIRQRKYRMLLPWIVLFPALYLFLLYAFCWPRVLPPIFPGMDDFSHWLVSRPKAALPVFPLCCAVLCLVQLRRLYRLERTSVTPMSVKEAVDSLPAGLCFYLTGGRIVLVNRTMEDLCAAALGETLINGERFRQRLLSGEGLRDGTALRSEPEPLLVMADGSAWAISERPVEDRGETLHMLLASNVTELYRKNLSLRQMRQALASLNDRLTLYYREIVDLTVQKEVLAARVRVHESMGGSLLMMKQYLQSGGSEAEGRALEERLRQSAGLLRTVQKPTVRDEYALILDTAEKLRFRIVIDGSLPQTEPRKHIIATALHECLTNTLRHARGDTLCLTLRERDGCLTAVLTNNGAQPREPVREGGGLSALRKLTEDAGGAMEVVSLPELTVTLKLPKEAPYAL